MVRYTACVDLHLILRDAEGRVCCSAAAEHWLGRWAARSAVRHLEDGEYATAGVAREAAEETGVVVKAHSLRLVHVMHHRTDSGRVALFFEARDWSSEVVNLQPDRCAGRDFTDPDEAAASVVPYVAEALRRMTSGEIYSGDWG